MASTSTSGGHAFHSIIPLASDSVASLSGTKHMPYDVFINHCGQDVKHSLASSIYNCLDAMGLRLFLDKDELKQGDFFPRAIEEAISSASLHIAIFSQHYSESPWCLAELASMVKTGNTILPIFYHVEPSDLRWAIAGKGKYADAFSEHLKKGRYGTELDRWKQALHEVSFCHGDIVKNTEDEQRVIKNVVHLVLKKMDKLPLEVTKYPVGLEEAVERFDEIALESTGPSHENVQIVGIWGMGGSGKTTLAKKIYNRIFSTIGRRSFLFDIRDAAGKGLLVEKQKKLLDDLDVKGVSFDNVDEGKGILKSRLRSLSVLIILDDVDHTDQLDALLPAMERLGNGSLIVVTTRQLDVLKAWDISAIYEMRALNATHVKQLFCWHAFKQPSPQPGFEDLLEEFLNACKGLPLSLKVLGGQLYGRSDKKYWRSQLHKLSRILPDDIKMRLRVSYDALDDEEKEMFLDIACFFIGWRKSVAIEIWEGSGWSGLHGWERLSNKCLVEEEKDGEITMNDHFRDLGIEVRGNIRMYCKIRMHDHLRDLGREIANKQSPYRLWFPQQSIQIHPQQEAVLIRGMVNAIGDNCYPEQGKIIIHTNQGERRLKPRSLGLKIFVGNGDFINQEYSELSGELVCLQCDGFKHINIPSWLSLNKLRILRLRQPHSLQNLWERDGDAPLQLRELFIESLFSQEFSLRGFPKSIAHLKDLKKILIFNCVRLSSLPEEFCLLESLELLDITGSENLPSLPSRFGELINLQHLDLKGCKKLKMLPDSFKKLRLLEYLNLEGCEELTIKRELHILENMTKLSYMNLNNCRKLEELGFLNGTSLTELYLEGTSLKELPANICQLGKLTELQIGSKFLTTLPASVGNLSSLTTLKIKGCNKLESLPDSLVHLNFLTDLDVSYSGVKCLPKSFIYLQNLTIEHTPISEVCFGPGCMLKSLTLEGTELSKLSICGDSCPHLQTLHLCWNNDLKEFETLPATLETIYISHCEVLKDIRGIRRLKNLQKLDIDLCERLDTLPNLAELTSLKRFTLKGSNKLEKIEGLESLISLETLEIRNCPELDGLPSLAELTSLRRFELQVCPKLYRLEGLASLRSLEWLIVAPGNRSALPFISNIQKWPREVMICAREVCNVGSLKIFFEELPNVSVLDYSDEGDIEEGYLKLRRPEISANVNAILICFIIDCVYPDLRFFINAGRGACFNTELSKGKWVWIGVFTQGSSWLQSNGEYISALSKVKRVEVKMEEAWLVMGEEGSIVEAFHPLLTRVTGA